jgi:hypothetical protein
MEAQDSSDVLTRYYVQGRESRAMRWVDIVARMAASAGVAVILVSTAAGADLLANGNMEQTGSNPNSIAGWSDWLWEGEAQISHTTAAAFEGTRATLLQGFGPTKIAIFQKVTLVPCSYRLTAAIAGMQLTAGTFGLSTAVFISYEARQPVLHQLLRGDSDWRRMDIEFSVGAATTATIYFFNYGSGYFFVDDVHLTAIDGCPMRATGLHLSVEPIAPLKFAPPISLVDTLLMGYCTNPSFARHDVCDRLRTVDVSTLIPKPASATHMLDDFEHSPSIFNGDWSYVSKAIAGRGSARLVAGRYMDADVSRELQGDWRGYDWLRFEVMNSSPSPQRISVEIRDTKTNDYWSRVNWNAIAVPGVSTIVIPLQVFVGEKSVIKQRRRLDLEHVTRLIISAAESNVTLVIDNVRLDQEPAYENDFPTLIKLDPGPITSPIMSGFHPLYPSLTYSRKRGYGFSNGTTFGRVEDRRHPDNLLRDWVSLMNGGLDIDLPNGNYHVWMMIEDPGYWEYYPNYLRRTLFIEGQPTHETQTAPEFLRKYYMHADDEDLPGDDIWGRYIATRFHPREFDVMVSDGQLNLRFNSHGDASALPLSALIIYPKIEEKRGKAFIAELWHRLKIQFDYEYKQVLPPLPGYAKPPANALGGKLWIFQRSIWEDVHATDWPASTELVESLRLNISKGEYKVLPISLHTKEKLQLIGADLSLPGFEIWPTKVRYKLTRISEDGSVYWNAPRLLDPLEVSDQRPLELPMGLTRTLWFDIRVSTAATGDVTGSLRLRFGNGETHSIPISVHVHPWTLPDVDVPIGYLGASPTYPQTMFPEMGARRRSEAKLSLHLLRQHGFTMISGGPGDIRFLGYGGGQVKLDVSQVTEFLSEARRLFRGEVGTYGGLAIAGLPKYGTQYSSVLRDVLDAIRKRETTAGWPRLIYSIGDEPDGPEIENVLSLARAFKEAREDSRTMVFTSLTDIRNDERSRFARDVSRIYLNVHTREALEYIIQNGKECALYNQHGRYRRGVYLFKLSKLGCHGHLQFAFNSVHADPWYDLDGRESDIAAVFTHPDGSLRRSLDVVRYRDAVTDYRYLLKLEQTIAEGGKHSVRDEAQVYLQQITNSIEIGTSVPPPWEGSTIDRVRERAAEHILALTESWSSDIYMIKE